METQIDMAKRPSLNLIEYHEKYGPDKVEAGSEKTSLGIMSKIKKKFKRRRLKPTRDCMSQFIFERIPFFNMLRNYKLNYILKDLMGGLTVGVIQIAPSN